MAILEPVGNVPDSQDINIYRGSKFSYPFTATTAADAPLDLSGHTITAHLRRYRLGPLVVAFTVVVESAEDGELTISLSAAQTAALKCGEFPTHSASRYWWDLKVDPPSGDTFFLIQGEAFVWAQATRS